MCCYGILILCLGPIAPGKGTTSPSSEKSPQGTLGQWRWLCHCVGKCQGALKTYPREERGAYSVSGPQECGEWTGNCPLLSRTSIGLAFLVFPCANKKTLQFFGAGQGTGSEIRIEFADSGNSGHNYEFRGRHWTLGLAPGGTWRKEKRYREKENFVLLVKGAKKEKK